MRSGMRWKCMSEKVMLSAVLEEEVSARSRYQRTKTFKGYRNGYHASRELTVGLSPIEVRVPRVSQECLLMCLGSSLR